MALEDALGVGADDNSTIPPQSILNDLITQRMPGIADSQGNVDPQSVLNRLIRHGLDRRRAPASEPQPQGTTGQPDFSQFGNENGAPPADFAQFGEEDPDAVAKRGRGAVSAFSRSAASGAIKAMGAATKGLGEAIAQQGAAEADVSGFPQEQVDALRSHEAMTENPLAKLGGRTQAYGDSVGPTEAEQKAHPIASTVGGIIGGVAAPVALGIIDPVAGIAGGAAMFGLSGYADTYDEALKHGASEETAQGAAALSGTVSAALGALPVAQVLAPVKAYVKVLPEAPGIVMRILGQAAESGIVFTGVGEAQEYLGQQIAKMYDPNAGYDPSWQRMASEFVAGAILGGGHQALHEAFGHEAQPQPDQAQQTQPGAQQPGTGAPPPGPQPTPGVGPERGLPPGGEAAEAPKTAGPQPTGSPKANDPYDNEYEWGDPNGQHRGAGTWYREAANGERWYYDPVSAKWEYAEKQADGSYEAAQPAPGGAGAQQGPQGGGDAGQAGQAAPGAQAGPQAAPEKPQPFASALKREVRSKLEDKANYYKEFSPDIIKSWSDDELKDYVTRKFGGGTARPSDDDILRESGMSDADIAGMSPEAKKAAADDAVAKGQMHTAAGPQGRREAPVDLKDGADVARAAARADQQHTPAQGEANNVQRGHATWNGLEITIEAPPGGVRRGVAPDGQPFETQHPHAYGYFTGLAAGADGMHPDVTIGDHPGAPTVYVLDEIDPKTKQFRQTKSFVGFQTWQDAVESYLGITTKDRSQLGGMRALSRDEFAELARRGGLSEPVSETMAHKGAVYNDGNGTGTAGTAGDIEPTAAHHQAIEDTIRQVGMQPHQVRPVDLARAAEIHANEGLSPQDAFQVAVLRAAVEDGLMTPEDVKNDHGQEIASLVASEPPQRGLRAQTRRAGPGGQVATGATEQLPGGRAHGAPSGEQAGASAEPGEGAEAPGTEAVRRGDQAGTAGYTESTGGTGAVQRPASGEQPAEADGGPNGKATSGGTEHEPAGPATKTAVNGKPAEGGQPFAGMIDNREKYRAAAKKRREDSAGGGGVLKVFGTDRGRLASQGKSVQEANAEREQQVAKASKAFDADMKARKISAETVPEDVRKTAIDYTIDLNMAPIEALDLAFEQAERQAVQDEGLDAVLKEWDREDKTDTGAAREEHPQGAVEAAAQAEEPGPAEANDEPGHGAVAPAGGVGRESTAGAGRLERTSAGEQHTLPGAERISDADLAKRKSEQPLKPKVEQKPADQGLFSDESKHGDLVDQASKPELAPAAAPPPTDLAGHFLNHFAAGKRFNNILAARRFAKDHGFGEDPKAVEEAIEFAIVQHGRDIAGQNKTQDGTFDNLLKLYQAQPILGTRTSTSMREQAYSTPVPLGFVASRLARVSSGKTVLEPTAGNGALLLEADPKHTTANEINPTRAQNLRGQGFAVTTDDATKLQLEPKFDVVLANPPFGPVRSGEGSSTVYDLSDIQPGYRTTEIDHAIVLRALQGLNDHGRATLILGGLNKQISTEQGRADGYNGKSKRQFFKALYDRYNVTDHFTVAGELYGRQGAGWPVDVVVINGRGRSTLPLPSLKPPRILTSWAEVKGLLNDDVRARNDVQPVAPAHGAASDVEPESGRGNAGMQPAPVGQPGRESADRQPAGLSGQPVLERNGAEAGQPGNAVPGGPGERGEPERPDLAAAAIGRPSDVEAFDRAFEGALDAAFGPKGVASAKTNTRAAGGRTAAKAAVSASENIVEGADKAMDALVELFGGGRTIGSGPHFDEDTYARAKPLFTEAANSFAEAGSDVGELLRRMIEYMQRVKGLTRDALERMKQYLRRFMQDVRDGIIRLGERAKEAFAKAPPREEKETALQLTYQPHSKAGALGTLVPKNMRDSIDSSLKSLEAKVGDLDHYVADKLGYTPGALADAFAAEQVDALALAIHNIDQGRALIIGDQTGIGKGRVNAAILRYAIKEGHVPVFVTEKPNLYKDIYRDLTDIGIHDFLGREPRILMTNAGERVPLDEEGKVVLRSASPPEHAKYLNGLVTAQDVQKAHDLVFTSFNQMQTVRGEDTPRRAFLRRIAKKAVFVLDESHNAGGQPKGERAAAVKPELKNRADFTRDLINQARGVLYSSATYAKRPDSMSLYSATDMAMAVAKPEDLAEAISRGGVPMQQAVAAMLAEGGQYIRRERSFSGVDYDTVPVAVDHVQYDGIARAMALINKFSHQVKRAAADLDAQLRSEGRTLARDDATGDTGVTSVNFTSIMHNIINQMLLSMKAGPDAQHAIEAIKRGEKPVLTVANTLEAFLKDTADNLGLNIGDALKSDFRQILHKYLDRTRTVTIKSAYENEEPERRYLKDEDLGPGGLGAYEEAKKHIDTLNLSGLPVSPIDHMKEVLRKAGYATGEITGRSLSLDYSGKAPILATRPGRDLSIAGRNRTITDFNNGRLDALVLNQAGATGISAHASEKFEDRRQRHMIIVQPEANIDTHMQMLGRVHRTGQVVVPRYSQTVADIPAEKRPGAVLSKKMASLNANTTASRGGVMTAKDVPDFINQYGDVVAANFAVDNPDLHWAMGAPINFEESGEPHVEDAMRKLTGRIMLLPLEQQEEVYANLESEYSAFLTQVNASGGNALEAKALDLKAKPIERTEVVAKLNESGSPFAAPVVMEKAKVARLGKPYTPAEVAQKVLASIGITRNDLTPENAAAIVASLDRKAQGARASRAALLHAERTASALGQFDDYKRAVVAAIPAPADGDEKALFARQDKELGKLNAVKDRWTSIDAMLPPGARLYLRTPDGNVTGVLLKVQKTGTPRNPLALSSWKATFAIPDAAQEITVPFSRLFETGKAGDDPLAIEAGPVDDWTESHAQTLDRFKQLQSDLREDRYIATGNLLAAFDWLNHRGQIVHFTDDKDNVRQGILTARGFDLVAHAKTKPRELRTPNETVQWLSNHPGEPATSTVGGVTIKTDPAAKGFYVVSANATKKIGGDFYLDHDLTGETGDFFKHGGDMIARFRDPDGSRIYKVLSRLQTLGAKFGVPSEAPKPQTVEPAGFAQPQSPYLDTDEFKRWFGDSKVVNPDGSPKVVYHGTDGPDDFSAFDQTEDIGFHFGSADVASKRLLTVGGYGVTRGESAKNAYRAALLAGREVEEGARVIPVYLKIANPLRLPDLRDWNPESLESALLEANFSSDDIPHELNRKSVEKALARKGYDGIVYRNAVEGKGDSYIVFDAAQVKSATGNAGTFDPTNPNMLAQGDGGQSIPQSRTVFDRINEGSTRPTQFVKAPRLPMGKQAQDHVVSRGIETGDEHLLAVDQKGQVVIGKWGGPVNVPLNKSEMAKLDDPNARIVIHHNHPLGMGLSNPDLSMLGSPGVEAVWAHGHDGGVSRAALTPAAKALFAEMGTPAQVRSALFRMADAIDRSVFGPIQGAVWAERVTVADAQLVTAELAQIVFHRAGLIDYRTNIDVGHLIEGLGLEPYIDKAVREAKGMLHARDLPAELRDDRPAEPLRHAGDVGASFETGRGVARHGGEQARPGSVSPGLARHEAARGPPEQLNPGFAAPWTSYAPAAATSKIRTALERATDILHAVQSEVAPMAVGSDEARAAVKDYSNAVRLAQYEWGRLDEALKKNFTPAELEDMWKAGDEENLIRQAREEEGRDLSHLGGLSRLTGRQRGAVDYLVKQANETLQHARDVGIFDGEGLAYYMPRMVVMMDEEGNVSHTPSGAPGVSDDFGRGFRTTTPQMKRRKYRTVEETEAAARKKFGEQAMVVRNLRALPLATAKLQEAVAARTLINKIKEVGRLAGSPTVWEGVPADQRHWFTMNHPAFMTWRPKLRPMTEVETAPFPPEGRKTAMTDEDGNTIFEKVPLYIRNDFAGPLAAALTRDSGKIYNGLMNIKGRSMAAIMYSPVIHNLVEWSRSLPAYPLKVASTMIYFEGNRAKNDRTTMNEAIRNGLVPIGKRFFNQDITSIAEEPNIGPRNSWTSQVLAFIPGLFDKGNSEAIKAAIDKAGDFWHNTLLWDRIGDLQMGLYVNFRRSMIKDGFDPLTASRYAAHFANRYAGAIPKEAMSSRARKFANVLLFSRSFTLGNLGAMKDAVTGLPRDISAQIKRDAGDAVFKKARLRAMRKALSIIALDIAINMITTSLFQDVLKSTRDDKDWFGDDGLFADYGKRFGALMEHAENHPADVLLSPVKALWSLSSTATNEPRKQTGREARVLLFKDEHGRFIYGKNPMGKIGDEFFGWPSAPGDVFLSKLSQFVRGPMQVLLNDKYAGAGFDRPTKIWRPDPTGVEWFENAGRIVAHILGTFVPLDALASATDLFFGHADDWRVDVGKAVAPLAGISISKGHPGGPGKAQDEYRTEQKRYDTQFEQQKRRPSYSRPDFNPF